MLSDNLRYFQEVNVLGWGRICPGGFCPGGLCPGDIVRFPICRTQGCRCISNRGFVQRWWLSDCTSRNDSGMSIFCCSSAQQAMQVMTVPAKGAQRNVLSRWLTRDDRNVQLEHDGLNIRDGKMTGWGEKPSYSNGCFARSCRLSSPVTRSVIFQSCSFYCLPIIGETTEYQSSVTSKE